MGKFRGKKLVPFTFNCIVNYNYQTGYDRETNGSERIELYSHFKWHSYIKPVLCGRSRSA